MEELNFAGSLKETEMSCPKRLRGGPLTFADKLEPPGFGAQVKDVKKFSDLITLRKQNESRRSNGLIMKEELGSHSAFIWAEVTEPPDDAQLQEQFMGLREGDRGKKVRLLQETLNKWLEEKNESIAVDGMYGPVTHRALESFKKSHHYGKDGSSMDPGTALGLAEIAGGKAGQCIPRDSRDYDKAPEDKVAASFEGFRNLREGSSGTWVGALKETLIKWKPEWRKILSGAHTYDFVVKKAVETFKKAKGLGIDGASLDDKTANLLAFIHRCEQFSEDEKVLRKAGKLFPQNYSPGALRIREIGVSSPERVVTYQNHRMKAITALLFTNLEREIESVFPGRKAFITSTMDGTHQDPGHYEGNSIDFVLTDNNYAPVYVSPENSRVLEKLCRNCGFIPYNEYILSSLYKTGPHMHVSRAR